MENRQPENTDSGSAQNNEEESELLNYQLVFPDRNGLSYDALFNLALIVDHVTVDPPMGDTRTQSQDDLQEMVAGNRPLVVINEVTDDHPAPPPHLIRYVTYPFDTIGEDPAESRQNIVPPFDSMNVPVPVDSWNDFVSDVLEDDADSEEESGYGSEDAEMDDEEADGYTADTESMDRIEQLSENGFVDGHVNGRARRIMARANGADTSMPRTVSGVRGLLACELLGPIRRPPVRLQSAPCRLQSRSLLDLSPISQRANPLITTEQPVAPNHESENVAGTSNDGALTPSTSRARSNSSNSALHSKEVRPTVSSSYGGDTHRRQVAVVERAGGGGSDSDSEH